MNPISVDIKDILVLEKLGIFEPDITKNQVGDLFIGKEPSEPDNCMTIYDTGFGGEQNPKFAIDESSIQIRYRSIDYLTGYNKLKEVKNKIEGKEQFKAGETIYVGIWASSNIAFMHYDENNRAIWISNYRIIRQPKDAGNRLTI